MENSSGPAPSLGQNSRKDEANTPVDDPNTIMRNNYAKTDVTHCPDGMDSQLGKPNRDTRIDARISEQVRRNSDPTKSFPAPVQESIQRIDQHAAQQEASPSPSTRLEPVPRSFSSPVPLPAPAASTDPASVGTAGDILDSGREEVDIDNPAKESIETTATGLKAQGGQGCDIGSLPVLPSYANRKENKKELPLVCQIVGCGISLISQAEYYQRYRICRNHLRYPAINVDGVAQRFCQQCGRFHELQFFDGDKRNCRSRLARHNSRRRKATLHLLKEEHGVDFLPHAEQARRIRGAADTNHLLMSEIGYRDVAQSGMFQPQPSSFLSGSRRSREVAFPESGQEGYPSLPPSLRSVPVTDPLMPYGSRSQQPLPTESARGPFPSRLIFPRNDSCPARVPSHRQDDPVDGYFGILREVELILGRQLVHALLLEKGLPVPAGYSSNRKPSAEGGKLLQMLLGQSSDTFPGCLKGPVISPKPINAIHRAPSPKLFSSPFDNMHSAAPRGSVTPSMNQKEVGFRSSASGGGDKGGNLNIGCLATTVPRSGFRDFGQLLDLGRTQMPPQRDSRPTHANPFLQARNTSEQQVDRLSASVKAAEIVAGLSASVQANADGRRRDLSHGGESLVALPGRSRSFSSGTINEQKHDVNIGMDPSEAHPNLVAGVSSALPRYFSVESRSTGGSEFDVAANNKNANKNLIPAMRSNSLPESLRDVLQSHLLESKSTSGLMGLVDRQRVEGDDRSGKVSGDVSDLEHLMMRLNEQQQRGHAEAANVKNEPPCSQSPLMDQINVAKAVRKGDFSELQGADRDILRHFFSMLLETQNSSAASKDAPFVNATIAGNIEN